ncbi:unnamed protein product [Camellia sinensis]
MDKGFNTRLPLLSERLNIQSKLGEALSLSVSRCLTDRLLGLPSRCLAVRPLGLIGRQTLPLSLLVPVCCCLLCMLFGVCCVCCLGSAVYAVSGYSV